MFCRAPPGRTPAGTAIAAHSAKPAAAAARVLGSPGAGAGAVAVPVAVPVAVRVDFGDGECVAVRVRDRADLAHMLGSVGAAGLRRRGANAFPTHDAPLLRDTADLDASHEYLTWPRAGAPDPGGRRF